MTTLNDVSDALTQFGYSGQQAQQTCESFAKTPALIMTGPGSPFAATANDWPLDKIPPQHFFPRDSDGRGL